MSNRVCDALGIQYPIIQGAMAWNSMPQLVAAVSNAGGLGVLGSGPMPPNITVENICEIRNQTDKPFGFNLFLDAGDLLEQKVEATVKLDVPVLYIDTLNLLEYEFTHRIYSMYKERGTKIVAKVNCLQDAEVAEKAGADVLVTKGCTGGGHKTKIDTSVLLVETVKHVSLPVCASGGIATPEQMAGYILMGAEGVEMGAAFIATEEANAHINYKNGIVKACDLDPVYVGDCTGEASWQLKNKKAERLMEIEAKYPREDAAPRFKQLAAGSGRIAATTGDVEENGSIMCGQAVALIDAVVPVSQRVEGMCRRCEEILRTSATLGL